MKKLYEFNSNYFNREVTILKGDSVLYLKNQKGLTLIEILASIVLFTVVIVLLLSVFPQMTNINNKTGENLDAANVGKEVLFLIKDKDNLTFNGSHFIGSVPGLTIKESTSNSLDGIYNSFYVEIIVGKEAFLEDEVANQLYTVEIIVKENKESKILTKTYGYIKEK